LNALAPTDSPLALRAKAEARRLNKDGISISAYEAHLIGFFMRQFQCSKVVELGTLTGYSGLKILESIVPHGHLWTLELDLEHARIASEIFEMAGYQTHFTILQGRAEEKLEKLAEQGPFDAVFIDANKAAYPLYLDWAMEVLRPRGLIIADNTLLRGVVPEPEEPSPGKIIRALREFNLRLTDQNLFDSILIPTDEGLSLAIKK
jgi:predicted O-methyltransferase YrrM